MPFLESNRCKNTKEFIEAKGCGNSSDQRMRIFWRKSRDCHSFFGKAYYMCSMVFSYRRPTQIRITAESKKPIADKAKGSLGP